MADYWPDGLTVRPLAQVGLAPEWLYSPFTAKIGPTQEIMRRELAALGARNVVLQIDLEARFFRLDGRPRHGSVPKTPVIVLSFDSDKGPLSFPATKYRTWEDNYRAIALGMEALRKVDRYGITQHNEQYRGWSQLTAGEQPLTADEAERILTEASGLHGVDPAVAYRTARKLTHPDHRGGDRAVWDLVAKAGKALGL